MVVVDGQGLPLGSHLDSASPAEVTHIDKTLATIRVRGRRGAPRTKSVRLIADRGYDSDWHRLRLTWYGIELIAPHRRNRKREKLQDGRALRRYRRRWKIERTISWISRQRRLVVRYERKLDIFRAFFNIACALIVLNRL